MYTEKQLDNLNHNFNGSGWSNFRYQDGLLTATYNGELHTPSCAYNGQIDCRIFVPQQYADLRFRTNQDFLDEARHSIDFEVI